CMRLGKNCGAVSGTDNCGVARSVASCGICTSPQSCGGAGMMNVCGCTPTTCAAQGKDCGSISNGCGVMISCGTCAAPQMCGGAGTANVCGCSGGGGADNDFDGYTVCAGDCNDNDATI